MRKIPALAYYDEAVPKAGTVPGDFVRLHYADGGVAEGMVAGCVLRGGEELSVDVITTQGVRFALHRGDEVEILTRSPRRSGF